MRLCQSHWNALREAIDDRGLARFVSQSGETAVKRLAGELEGESGVPTFDPLMAANMAIWSNAIEAGGLYLLTGDLCPLCESESHGGYPADWWIKNAADEQLQRARDLGLGVEH